MGALDPVERGARFSSARRGASSTHTASTPPLGEVAHPCVQITFGLPLAPSWGSEFGLISAPFWRRFGDSFWGRFGASEVSRKVARSCTLKHTKKAARRFQNTKGSSHMRGEEEPER